LSCFLRSCVLPLLKSSSLPLPLILFCLCLFLVNAVTHSNICPHLRGVIKGICRYFS
jgi:uncharacterized membrane protein YvlD (DUF360 family)